MLMMAHHSGLVSFCLFFFLIDSGSPSCPCLLLRFLSANWLKYTACALCSWLWVRDLSVKKARGDKKLDFHSRFSTTSVCTFVCTSIHRLIAYTHTGSPPALAGLRISSGCMAPSVGLGMFSLISEVEKLRGRQM